MRQIIGGAGRKSSEILLVLGFSRDFEDDDEDDRYPAVSGQALMRDWTKLKSQLTPHSSGAAGNCGW
jgi:hypothetical protein